jgi:hypothetical protein
VAVGLERECHDREDSTAYQGTAIYRFHRFPLFEFAFCTRAKTPGVRTKVGHGDGPSTGQFGGALSITTRDPAFESEATLQAGVGNDGALKLRGLVNAALLDRVAGREPGCIRGATCATHGAMIERCDAS